MCVYIYIFIKIYTSEKCPVPLKIKVSFRWQFSILGGDFVGSLFVYTTFRFGSDRSSQEFCEFAVDVFFGGGRESCFAGFIVLPTGNGNAILDPFLVTWRTWNVRKTLRELPFSGFFHLQGPTSTRGPTACLLHGRGRPKRGSETGIFLVLKETWETWQIKLLDLGGGWSYKIVFSYTRDFFQMGWKPKTSFILCFNGAN